MIRRRITDRADLIQLLRDHPLSRSFKRALDNGTVTVLGGFTPSEGFSYYGVDVTSVHGRTWHTRVIADDARLCWVVQRAEQVDWKDWIGWLHTDDPLKAGDPDVIPPAP